MRYYSEGAGVSEGLSEGDVLLSNHPQLAGGSHLPDITAITPVFRCGGWCWGVSKGRRRVVDLLAYIHKSVWVLRPEALLRPLCPRPSSPYPPSPSLPPLPSLPAPPVSGGKIVFFVASRGHHADIGGISPGSMPPHSKLLVEEGAAIVSFKIVRKGEFQVLMDNRVWTEV